MCYWNTETLEHSLSSLWLLPLSYLFPPSGSRFLGHDSFLKPTCLRLHSNIGTRTLVSSKILLAYEITEVQMGHHPHAVTIPLN